MSLSCEVLGRCPLQGDKRVLPHKYSKAEELALWQGRFAALSEVDGNFERVSGLLEEARGKLTQIRKGGGGLVMPPHRRE